MFRLLVELCYFADEKAYLCDTLNDIYGVALCPHLQLIYLQNLEVLALLVERLR